jgi:hypothetical protein
MVAAEAFGTKPRQRINALTVEPNMTLSIYSPHFVDERGFKIPRNIDCTPSRQPVYRISVPAGSGAGLPRAGERG